MKDYRYFRLLQFRQSVWSRLKAWGFCFHHPDLVLFFPQDIFASCSKWESVLFFKKKEIRGNSFTHLKWDRSRSVVVWFSFTNLQQFEVSTIFHHYALGYARHCTCLWWKIVSFFRLSSLDLYRVVGTSLSYFSYFRASFSDRESILKFRIRCQIWQKMAIKIARGACAIENQ